MITGGTSRVDVVDLGDEASGVLAVFDCISGEGKLWFDGFVTGLSFCGEEVFSDDVSLVSVTVCWIPRSFTISSLPKPFDSRNAILRSVDVFRIVSSSRNLFAWANKSSLDVFDSDSGCSDAVVVDGGWRCQSGMAASLGSEPAIFKFSES